jgi:hypothetical protein
VNRTQCNDFEDEHVEGPLQKVSLFFCRDISLLDILHIGIDL